MSKLIAGYRGYFLENSQPDDLREEMLERLDFKERLCHSPHEVRDNFVGDPCLCPNWIMYALPYAGDGTILPDLKLAILISDWVKPHYLQPLYMPDSRKLPLGAEMLIAKQVITVKKVYHVKYGLPQPHE